MKYKPEDIKPINVEEHVIKRQEMYFGTRGANPESISCSIAEGALILGAKETHIKEYKGWWLVSADVDWLNLASIIETDEKTIFERFSGFPEAGDNWYRSEIMARVFSECCLTFKAQQLSLIFGQLPEPNVLNELKQLCDKWQRSIVFKFIKKA